MKSYLLGFLSFALTILLIVLVLNFLDLRKEKPNKKKTLIYSFFGISIIIIMFYISKSIFGFQTEKDTLFFTILFTLIITPFFEEIFYRRWILQHLINIKDRQIKIKDFLVMLWIGLALIIPNIIFFLLGIISAPKLSSFKFIILFSILPIIFIYLLKNYKTRTNNYLLIFVMIFSQAVLFTFGHGDYTAKMLLFTGILYGILYLGSKSIIPPLIAHYVWNVLIFIYSF